MSENGDDVDGVDEYNPLDHQACYIFTPSEPATTTPSKRRNSGRAPASANKRRRPKNVVHEEEHTEDESPPFLPLLNGSEPAPFLSARWKAYNDTWTRIESTITSILDELDLRTVRAVQEYVSSAESTAGKIPTALIMAGSNIAAHSRLFEQMRKGVQEGGGTRVVLLSASDGGGLKGALKRIVRDGTMGEGGGEDEDEVVAAPAGRGRKMLNYDLRILADWCKGRKDGSKVVVAIQDIEAFDAAVFAELVGLLTAYLDRIPFVLLLGVATSLEIFHERIPKGTIRLMDGKRFNVERAGDCLEKVFNTTVIPGCANGGIIIGPSICDWTTKRQQNHAQSIQATIASIKYAHMSHFFANPLSALVAEDSEGLVKQLTDVHLEAIRNTQSFKRLVEQAIETKDTEEARKLLENDVYLRDTIDGGIEVFRTYGLRLMQGLVALEIARSCTASQQTIPRYELYIKALNGDLKDSPLVRDLLLSVKKMASDALLKLLEGLRDETLDADLISSMDYCYTSLNTILAENPAVEALRLPAAQASQSFTVRSKRFETGTQDLNPAQEKYKNLLSAIHNSLSNYFTKALGPPPTFLREVFIYDSLSPVREVLAPSTRTAIENALAAPTNYLACDCCAPAEDPDHPEANHEVSLGWTLPPTSILYKLYLESGSIINIYDLWKAFQSVLCTRDEGDEEIDEEMAQALFYRAVAELRFMGMVKYSRGRKDCLLKVAWRGV